MHTLFKRAQRQGGASRTSHDKFAAQLLDQILKAQRFDLFSVHALHNLGHIRGGGTTDCAALAFPVDGVNFASGIEVGVDGDDIGATGIAPAKADVGLLQGTVVAPISLVDYKN